MTHLHSIIKNALLPVCLETTAKARQEEEKSVEIDAMVDPVMTELQKFMSTNTASVSKIYLEFTCEALAIITRKPYLANAWKDQEVKKQVYAPLTIIMPSSDNWSDMSIGMVVLHSGKQLVLNSLGYEIVWTVSYQVRLATDEEVEHFLDTLNSTAIRMILKNDLFAPMIEAMTQETELVVEKTEPDTVSGEEIQDP